MNHCKLSVVIVNYNSHDLMEQCIAHIGKVVPAETEVIVVDNNSSDGSAEWLCEQENYPIKSICLAKNIGFAAGCNKGIERSTGEYILLLNTDAFPKPGSLAILVDYLDQNQNVGIVGPQLLYPDNRWQLSAGRLLSPNSAMRVALGITSLENIISRISWRFFARIWQPKPVDFLAGASMLLRHTMIDKIGLLDTRFFFFAEDLELCYRARQQGWGVMIVPTSQVIHLRGGSSFRKAPIKTIRMLYTAEREFILGTFGGKAWNNYLFWMRLNFAWRTLLAKALGDQESYKNNKASIEIYSKPSNENAISGDWI